MGEPDKTFWLGPVIVVVAILAVILFGVVVALEFL